MGIFRTLKNYTPHDITILDMDGKELMKLPSVGLARRIREVVRYGAVMGEGVPDVIPLNVLRFGNVFGLPPYDDDILLIVSYAVAAACPDRRDLFVPGPLKYDTHGKVLGCHGLVTLAELHGYRVVYDDMSR